MNTNKITVISLDFQGIYHVMNFDEMIEEIIDIASNDNEGFTDYLEEYRNSTIEEYAKFKTECAISALNTDCAYEYNGVEYCILDYGLIKEKIEEFYKLDDFIELNEDWFIFEKGASYLQISNWFKDNLLRTLLY